MSIDVIAPGGRKSYLMAYRFLQIKQANMPFQISSLNFPAFTVTSRGVDLETPQEIVVTNLSSETALEIELDSTPLKVFDSEAVSITSLPAIELAPNQSLQVGEVGFPEGANLSVNNFPAEFGINNFPAQFNVGNFPTEFGINNFPAQFNVGNFPADFGINNPVEIDKTGDFVGLPQIDFSANQQQQIAVSAGRKVLFIKARLSNTGTIWVGSTAENVGTPLERGESMTIEVEHLNAINVYAENTADKLTISEVVKV